MNSILDNLASPEVWENFYNYRTSLISEKRFTKLLRDFIDTKGYLEVYERIASGQPFPLPEKSIISKISTGKKRTVYTYPEAENITLKLLTWLMLRKYDSIFSEGLYSFRPGRTAKDAVRRLVASEGIDGKYAYKADVSDYFNSVPVDRLLPILEEVMKEDEKLFLFLKGLLTEDRVSFRGNVIEERKGIMAGTPVAAFLANLYLMELDRSYDGSGKHNGYMANDGCPENDGNMAYDAGVVIYSRYSDDIIVLADSAEELQVEAERIRGFLERRGLKINPDKESFFSPEEGWTFLGFSYCRGKIDIAPVTIKKLKAKMRRKARALKRWGDRNEVQPEKCAKAFIRVFNRKLLESPADNELSWAYWFFPVINTTDSLKAIDHYAQECIRYLLTGRRNKGRFNASYEDMKRLGYRSLVHEYYEK